MLSSVDSYALRTLHACSRQSELKMLKICKCSMLALFLYNCTLNSNIARGALCARKRHIGLIQFASQVISVL